MDSVQMPSPEPKMENLAELAKRISIEAARGANISGLVFPENLWHRMGVILEKEGMMRKHDDPPHNAFMGISVETSPLIPGNRIAIMGAGRMPIGMIALAEDGTATVHMVSDEIRKQLMADRIHDIFHADLFRSKS